MTWTAAVTLAIAVLGAALGIINTWHGINDRRVKLRVRGSYAFGLNMRQAFAIEVTNLSSFPLTLHEVGLLHERPRDSLPKRVAIPSPMLNTGGTLPLRLEAREQVTAYFDVVELPTGRPFWAAYARTACGEIATGRSAALDQLGEIVAGVAPARREWSD